ncbi:hypothetical protein BC940DRAFT_323329 [Gongronella butleri]|nr:hypothetical protein BC940DRAFT_323329 [Gongronella butleri]
MPLLNRKPFTLIDPPSVDLADQASKKDQVWYCPYTHEIFDSYATYLERLHLYKQPVWQCEATGRGNLTYEEALKAEQNDKEKLESKLPDQLRKALLIHAQFRKKIERKKNTSKARQFTSFLLETCRLEKVVEMTYDYFQDRFVAGEQLDCEWDDGVLYTAKVLEAPPLEDQTSDNVEYKIQLLDEDFEGIDEFVKMMPRSSIRRDRFGISKSLLKRYFRESLTKEAYLGAPWTVQPAIAERYGIDTTLPRELALTRDTAMRKSKKLKEQVFAESQLELQKLGLTDRTDAKRIESAIKYPVEDLDLPAYRRVPPIGPYAVIMDMRPGSENATKDVPNPTGDLPLRPKPCQESTVATDCFGSFLMVWSFLNVFSRPLCLSPFSLDDFESALHYNSNDVKCELVYEVIASLLNCIIRHRLNHGTQRTANPAENDNDASQTQHYQLASRMNDLALHESRQGTPDDDMDIDSKPVNGHAKPNRHHDDRGCGSATVADVGSNWDAEPIHPGNHRRGWEDVLIGALNDLVFELHADVPRYDAILSRLVPHMKSSLEDRERAYLKLPLRDKLAILEILVHAVNETQSIKEYMEDCQEQLTDLRRQKIELGRERRRIISERNAFEKSIGENENDNTSQASSSLSSGLSDSDEAEEEQKTDVKAMTKQARSESRQAMLKRKQKEREEEEAKRRRVMMQQRQIARERNQELRLRAQTRRKLDDDEAKVQKKLDQVEKDMRRYNTLRCKPLGRDKFYHRYYYMDNVGGSFAHGSGRLFVQSPSMADLLMLFDRELPEYYEADSAALAANAADSTEQDSKKAAIAAEAGYGGGYAFICQLMDGQGLSDKAALLKSHLASIKEGEHFEWWESFDDPESLDKLLDWLNPKGVREHALKKELMRHWHGLMQGMKKNSSDRSHAHAATDSTRRSTRTKANVTYPVGSWFNYTNKLAK